MTPAAVIPPSALEPLLVDAAGAARLCGVSRAFWMQLHAADRVPRPLHLGRRVLWPVADLKAWVAASMPSAEQWGRDAPMSATTSRNLASMTCHPAHPPQGVVVPFFNLSTADRSRSPECP